jgi:predicted ferric reductase
MAISMSGEIVGEISLYIFFIVFLVMAITQYIRAEKPYWSGLIGLLLIIGIAGSYLIGKLFFSRTPFLPPYIAAVPPLGLVWCIYYLTYTQNKRNRFLIAVAAIGLIGSMYFYLSSLLSH